MYLAHAQLCRRTGHLEAAETAALEALAAKVRFSQYRTLYVVYCLRVRCLLRMRACGALRVFAHAHHAVQFGTIVVDL